MLDYYVASACSPSPENILDHRSHTCGEGVPCCAHLHPGERGGWPVGSPLDLVHRETKKMVR